MLRQSAISAPRRRYGLEPLERRCLLSAAPFGAAPDDTAEYMLGDVLVTVVLLESDGSVDLSSEDWTTSQIQQAKDRAIEGTQWWSDVLKLQSSVHELNFHYDFTFADEPVQTGYEPIARKSNDFVLWIDDFFAAAGVDGGQGFSERILDFNHQQRLKFDTDWAFTIFIVNADHDPDNRFDASGSFSRAFAYAGGRFFVTTTERPAGTIAHETGHMFWALDEYAGSKSYHDRRGYYDTQNTNATDDHPDPSRRVRSIMDSHLTALGTHAVSPSAMEMIGWKDSDQNGVFDVLDVPHQLDGAGEFDSSSSSYLFAGSAEVSTLPNQNSSGNGNAITLNEISRVEVRFNDSNWETVEEFGEPQVDLNFRIVVPADASLIEIRAIDDATGVTSPAFVDLLDRPPVPWQNLELAFDVNDDQNISPLDALLVINELNQGGPRELSAASPEEVAGHYVDVNGDGFISPVDALLVINHLNLAAISSLTSAVSSHGAPAAEGEAPTAAAVAAAFDIEIDRRESGESATDSRDEPRADAVRTARWVDLAVGEFFNGGFRPRNHNKMIVSWFHEDRSTDLASGRLSMSDLRSDV